MQMRNRGVRYDFLKLREERASRQQCANCGITLPKRRKFYCSHECATEWWEKTNWVSFRETILERDKHGCTECHRPHEVLVLMGRSLEVHHDVPVRMNQKMVDMEREFDGSNCRTVCNVCHKRLTRRQYRANSLLYRAGRQQTLLKAISQMGGSSKPLSDA